MSTVKAKHTVTTFLAVFALLVSMFAFAVPVGARGAAVITVPSGNVDALYDAVYDESGQPKDNVKIFLEPGVYALEAASTETGPRPFGGRLVLGDGTVLYSSLRMAVDDNGVPLVDDNFEPEKLADGAVIDSTKLEPNPSGDGVIVVGDRGLVEGLQVEGGKVPGNLFTDPRRPGIEITSRGEVRQVYSTNHSIGLRVRAATKTAQGTLEGNVTTGNLLAGISVISTDESSFPYDDAPRTNRTVRAILLRNTSVNNGNANFTTYGGVGTDKNRVHVKAFYNHFGAGPMAFPFFTNVRIVGGLDFYSRGAHDNKVEFVSVGNVIAGSDTPGLVATGGLLQDFFLDPSIDPEVRQSWGNEVVVTISDTMFENNQPLDVHAIGSAAYGFEPGGQPNTANVFVDSGPSENYDDQDCTWLKDGDPKCTSKATITISKDR